MLNQKDPYLLLSVVNTKLRDEASSFEDLCKIYSGDKEGIIKRLETIGYKYEKENNQFINI